MTFQTDLSSSVSELFSSDDSSRWSSLEGGVAIFGRLGDFAEERFFLPPVAGDDVLLLSRTSNFLTARLSLSSSPLPEELETYCRFPGGLGLAFFDDTDAGFGTELLEFLLASSVTDLGGKGCELEWDLVADRLLPTPSVGEDLKAVGFGLTTGLGGGGFGEDFEANGSLMSAADIGDDGLAASDGDPGVPERGRDDGVPADVPLGDRSAY